jgi:chemotaxis signal transduction protein
MAEAISRSTAAHHEENQLVTFYLGNEEFGFDIMSVQEIIRQPQLSRIPMAPDYVEGIANLRGTVLPVIDTRTRFGMKREDDTDRTRVLVVDVDGVKTGLRVDRVRQVTRIEKSDIEPPPEVIRSGMTTDYLKGVVKLEAGKRIIMSLRPGAICKVDLGKAGDVGLAAAREDLAGRARDDAGAGPSTDGDQSVAQLVSFKLGEEEFAFPMDRVREILRVQRPNVVPDTPDYFLGILTVRGNILPVIDLRILLGLRALSTDVRESAARARGRYERWLATIASFAASGSAARPGLAGSEELRAWVAAFTTSSLALMETLSRLRVANDKVLRGGHAFSESWSAEVRTAHFEAEVAPAAAEAMRLLGVFEGEIEENIREDQRLVVVQTGGTLLALLVDKVREVLNVPTRLVDAPPQIGNQKNSEIRGVARLNEGKRLIMLLDADHLVEGQALEAVHKAGGGHSEESMGIGTSQQASGDGAQSLGERQFVTFRLADGEYGIPINEIQEIDRSSKMTRIPKSAEYVDGITNLRGEVIPVINARKRFNLPVREADEHTRVIIIEVGGKKTGLLVDSVREVLNLSQRDIAPPPSSICAGVDKQYISGIGKVDSGKRMIVLLDVSQVVDAVR